MRINIYLKDEIHKFHVLFEKYLFNNFIRLNDQIIDCF